MSVGAAGTTFGGRQTRVQMGLCTSVNSKRLRISPLLSLGRNFLGREKERVMPATLSRAKDENNAYKLLTLVNVINIAKVRKLTRFPLLLIYFYKLYF